MLQRKVVAAQVRNLAEDEVEVTISTGALARDGHILVPEGCLLENYRANPIVLWSHDPDVPMANATEIVVESDKIRALVKAAPRGISKDADEKFGLVKAGVVRAVSVGFDPLDGEPLDKAKPRGGMRITKWELLEFSFCSVPVDAGALVTARAMDDSKSPEWKVGASRNLPVEDSDTWDGAEAEASVFEWAGGDEFSPAKARKAFLVYDAANPKLRGSYKLPIAHVVDGRLKVPKGAIRAASSRLPQTDIPEEAKTSAGEVIAHYEEKAGMSGEKDKDKERRLGALRTRMIAKPAAPMFRGLYDVASLAYALENLGYVQACAAWEAECEGDESPVPAMLGEALKTLGEALIVMTSEEVAELLERFEDDEEGDAMSAEDRAFVEAAASDRARAWRRGIVRAKQRSGRVLSRSNAEKLSEVHDGLEKSRAMLRAVLDEAAGSDDDDMKTEKKGDERAQTAPSTRAEEVETDEQKHRRRQIEILRLAEPQ